MERIQEGIRIGYDITKGQDNARQGQRYHDEPIQEAREWHQFPDDDIGDQKSKDEVKQRGKTCENKAVLNTHEREVRLEHLTEVFEGILLRQHRHEPFVADGCDHDRNVRNKG